MSVHLGYTVGDFHCLLDSDLFLPKSWANDPARRKEAKIPEEAQHRSKPQMALAQIERALRNGIRVAAWTFDEHYGQSYAFLDGLDALGQTYVAEVPCAFHGWAMAPRVLYRATPQEMRKKHRKRRYPRLAKTAAKASEVRNLLNHSPSFAGQSWTPIHIKDGEKGPMVREVKVIEFRMQRDGLPTRPHWLIAARNPEEPDGVKFFVSNASGGIPLEWLVYVAYSRWPIEQCFKEEKDELGFDHFEVRGWRSIHRHMALTQVSHLYLNKMRKQLIAEEQAQEEAGVFSLPRPRRQSSNVPRRKSHAQSDSRCPGRLVSSLAFGAGWP
jgi:SRSO17 transposase